MLIINIKEKVDAWAITRMLEELNLASKRGDYVHVLPHWAEAIQVNDGPSYLERKERTKKDD